MTNVETEVADYIVATTLGKVLRWDRQYAGKLQLGAYWSHAWDPMLGLVERESRVIRRKLASHGCRILTEELGTDKSICVRYLCEGSERTCTLLPVLLKRRCESKLIALLRGGEPG